MVWRHFVTKFSLQKNSHSYIQPWQDIDTNITSLNIAYLTQMYPLLAQPSFEKFLGVKKTNHFRIFNKPSVNMRWKFSGTNQLWDLKNFYQKVLAFKKWDLPVWVLSPLADSDFPWQVQLELLEGLNFPQLQKFQ